MTITFGTDGHQLQDRISGTIRWVESPERKSNGEGQYEFDIRVNEPVAAESSIFASSSDESAYFQTDLSIPSLTGLMKYKDTMVGETVTASVVRIDLAGNKITKQQCMNLAKLFFFSSIVPINAE